MLYSPAVDLHCHSPGHPSIPPPPPPPTRTHTLTPHTHQVISSLEDQVYHLQQQLEDRKAQHASELVEQRRSAEEEKNTAIRIHESAVCVCVCVCVCVRVCWCTCVCVHAYICKNACLVWYVICTLHKPFCSRAQPHHTFLL